MVYNYRLLDNQFKYLGEGYGEFNTQSLGSKLEYDAFRLLLNVVIIRYL